MADNNSLLQEATAATAPPVVAHDPPTTSGSTLKRNSDEIETSNKRPKVILDDSNSSDAAAVAASTDDTTEKNASETKTVVTPTSAAEAGTATTTTKAAAKKDSVPSTSTPSDKNAETLDIAETLGLKPGSVIEVQWEIQNETNSDENEQQQQNQQTTNDDQNNQAEEGAAAPAAGSDNNSASLHWWKATLLEHDGRTTDSVAIRTLQYEARPDLGFPEPSKEDIVFLGKEVLITSTDSSFANWDTNPEGVNQMPYRRVRSNKDDETDGAYADEVFFYTDDQLDEQLNSLLMEAFKKNQAAFNSIPAAQQAVIAEAIQKKKEELKEILRTEAKNKVVTAETIKDILARAF